MPSTNVPIVSVAEVYWVIRYLTDAGGTLEDIETVIKCPGNALAERIVALLREGGKYTTYPEYPKTQNAKDIPVSTADSFFASLTAAGVTYEDIKAIIECPGNVLAERIIAIIRESE